MDDKDYLDLETRPSDSYLELEARPCKSYLELEARPSDPYLKLEKRPTNSDLVWQRGPSDSYLDLETRPSDSYLDIDLKPPSSHFGLRDEMTCSPRPAKDGIPTSQPTNGEIVYDDTVGPQNRPAGSNGTAQRDQGAFLQPPSWSSSSYPACNALPQNGNGRKGQALPDPPPEANMCHLNSFNTTYNTASRRAHCKETATCHGSTTRQLSEAGQAYSATSSRCCVRCRDVFWLIFGLAMTAACIGGCYYSTRTVVAQLCQSKAFSLDDAASTTLYGEMEFMQFNGTVNTTVFDPWFKSSVENAMQDTVLSFFLKNVTIVGFSKGASTNGPICRFTMTLRLSETKRRGLENFALRLLNDTFVRYSPERATLRCIVIPASAARTYSCPEDRMRS